MPDLTSVDPVSAWSKDLSFRKHSGLPASLQVITGNNSSPGVSQVSSASLSPPRMAPHGQRWTLGDAKEASISELLTRLPLSPGRDASYLVTCLCVFINVANVKYFNYNQLKRKTVLSFFYSNCPSLRFLSSDDIGVAMDVLGNVDLEICFMCVQGKY